MKIQFDVPEDIMKSLAFYKIEHGLKSKSEAVLKILSEYFKQKNS